MGIKQDIMQSYQTIDTTVCQQEFDIRDDSFSESNELVNNNKRIFREEPDMHHTLIDKSNNSTFSRISLSPAWSEDDSGEERLESSFAFLDFVVELSDDTATRIYWEQQLDTSSDSVSSSCRMFPDSCESQSDNESDL